jgi:hypothetical protein
MGDQDRMREGGLTDWRLPGRLVEACAQQTDGGATAELGWKIAAATAAPFIRLSHAQAT